jgi:hypothetical protein
MGLYRIWLAPDGKPRGALAAIAEGLPMDDFGVAPNGDVYFPAGPVLYRIPASGGAPVRYVDPIRPGPAAVVSRDGRWLFWPTNEVGAGHQRILRAPLP